MKTPFLQVLLFLIPFVLAHAGPKEDWAKTGINLAFVEENFFQDCTEKEKNFVACIEILSGLRQYHTKGAFILPASIANQPEIRILGNVPGTDGKLKVVTYKKVRIKDLAAQKLYTVKINQLHRKRFVEYQKLYAEGQITNAKLLKTFKDWLAAVPRETLDEIGSEQLAGDLTNAGLRLRVDPHTRIQPENEYNETMSDATNGFGGIGMAFQVTPKGVEALAIFENSPARKADIRRHDLVLSIDGVSVTGLSREEVHAKIVGTIGSSVTFEIERGEEVLKKVMVRDKRGRVYPSLTVFDGVKVGVLQITTFMGSNLFEEMIENLQILLREGIQTLVLDVRNNGGGSLQEVLEILSYFVGEGVLLNTVPLMEGQHAQSYYSPRPKGFTGPMMVLQNRSSASASEILAGVLKYYRRAIIIGETSYGKGLVQTASPDLIIPDTKLGPAIAKLKELVRFATISRYEFEDETGPQLTGIVPDIELVEDPFEPAIFREMHWTERDLYGTPAGAKAQSSYLPEGKRLQLEKCVKADRLPLCEFTQIETQSIYRPADFQVMNAASILKCITQLNLSSYFGY